MPSPIAAEIGLQGESIGLNRILQTADSRLANRNAPPHDKSLGFRYTHPHEPGYPVSYTLNASSGRSIMSDVEPPAPEGDVSDAPGPALSPSNSSHEPIGLPDDGPTMTRSLSMRPAIEDTSDSPAIEFEEAGYRWRVAECHADIIQAHAADWLNPGDSDHAERIKRNSHRSVWRIRCGERTYFAKFYDPSDLLIRIKVLFRGSTAVREWDVGTYAAAHGIAAVVPVATALKGYRGLGGPSLLITEAVEGVVPLNEYWLAVRSDRHRANLLTESLARLIARAHQCGFQHGDMHPGNILVRPVGRHGEALFVDLHNVRIGRSVSLAGAVANLAQLNQWFRRASTLSQRRRFLHHYLDYRDRFAQAGPFARNHSFDPRQLIAQLAVRAEKHANTLWAKRDRRTRRTGRYFARVRPAPGWHGHALLRSKHPAPTAHAAALTYDRRQWETWLRDPRSWVDPNQHRLLKDSHTATICKAELPVEPTPVGVIVKRTLARNGWKRLLRIFGPSRNMRSWKMANMLLSRDLHAAQPLAVVERHLLGCLRIDSIGLTDYIAGSVDLETFLTRDIAALPPSQQRRVKDQTIATIVKLIKRFHDRGFVHRDLKAPNLLVNWAPPYAGKPELTLIDMDGIKHVRRPSPNQRRRAVVRLCASLLHAPALSRTDRLRFLLHHLRGPACPPTHWKSTWREWDALVRTKQHTKEKRRKWKIDHYGRE